MCRGPKNPQFAGSGLICRWGGGSKIPKIIRTPYVFLKNRKFRKSKNYQVEPLCFSKFSAALWPICSGVSAGFARKDPNRDSLHTYKGSVFFFKSQNDLIKIKNFSHNNRITFFSKRFDWWRTF